MLSSSIGLCTGSTAVKRLRGCLGIKIMLEVASQGLPIGSIVVSFEDYL